MTKSCSVHSSLRDVASSSQPDLSFMGTVLPAQRRRDRARRHCGATGTSRYGPLPSSRHSAVKTEAARNCAPTAHSRRWFEPMSEDIVVRPDVWHRRSERRPGFHPPGRQPLRLLLKPAAHREAHQAGQPDDQKRQAAGLGHHLREYRDAARVREIPPVGQGFTPVRPAVPASATKTSPVNGSTVIECALVVVGRSTV